MSELVEAEGNRAYKKNPSTEAELETMLTSAVTEDEEVYTEV
jgi:hypothetical protein